MYSDKLLKVANENGYELKTSLKIWMDIARLQNL